MVAEFHGNEVSEPIVADNFFSCRMKMDATFKEGGRQSIEEICLYQVENGKIVKEEFFYTSLKQENFSYKYICIDNLEENNEIILEKEINVKFLFSFQNGDGNGDENGGKRKYQKHTYSRFFFSLREIEV